MGKHNDYPHKFTIRKVTSSGGKEYRVQCWFPKKDAEKIFEAAAQGKELVFKITSDPSTLKEKSIGLLLEPIPSGEEAYENYQKMMKPLKADQEKQSSEEDESNETMLDKIRRAYYSEEEIEEMKKQKTTGE